MKSATAHPVRTVTTAEELRAKRRTKRAIFKTTISNIKTSDSRLYAEWLIDATKAQRRATHGLAIETKELASVKDA
jgi:hypothetical protein